MTEKRLKNGGRVQRSACFLIAVLILAVLAAALADAGIFGRTVLIAEAAEAQEGAGSTGTQTVTETVIRTAEVHQVITYDIWKHINGVWQFGKAPGSSVSGSFTLSFGSKLPDGAKVTGMQGAYDSAYAGVHSANIVPSAAVSIKSFGDKNFTYSFAAKLNGTPEDIKKSTQAEEVEGYRYYIPCVFEVTYEVTVEKEVPKEEEGEPDDGAPIDPGADITGEVHLYLPEVTYEGHSVKADDRSVFTVNNRTYGAARMYSEGLASNKFKASGAGSSTRRSGNTSAEVSFAQAGRANVLLTVTTKTGLKLTDKQDIEVLRTPNISSVLGGTQKQNRKQTITAEIAVNPSHPLKELWIEIEKKGGNERVHLTYDTDGGKNSLQNSQLIKTRAIADNGSSSLFTRVKLDFLTKNSEETEMTYRIYAKDDRGYTSTLEKAFTVAPDEAPRVVIDAEKEQLRDEQSSIAHVYAEDGTAYDGDDAERVWYVREHGESKWQKAGNDKGAGSSTGTADVSAGGISDASFGTWKAVTYEKRGVGKLDIRLDVTEKWTEDTLPEYVSESDRLSGSAEAEVNVINIAPVVSLTSSHMNTANLLFLEETAVGSGTNAENSSTGGESGSGLKTAAASIRNALFEKGISAKISTERVKSTEDLNGGDMPDSVFKLKRSYGYGAEDTFLEKDWYLCGKDTLYTADGTWTRNTDMNINIYNIDAPYTINAYDLANDGALKWSSAVTKESLGNAAISDIKGMALDDRGKYLFFRSTDRTLVYDGETGAYTAAVPISLGDDNYAENGKIYTVKADGIYSVDMRNGSVKRIYAGNICMKSAYCDASGSSKRVNNEVSFFAGKGTKLTHGIFNMSSETFRFEEIYPSQANYGSTYSVLGIGADGKACIGQDGVSKAYVFDTKGAESTCLSGWKIGAGHAVMPAYKSDGTFDYIAVVYNSDSRSGTSKSGYKMNYRIYADLYSAYAGNAANGVDTPQKIAEYSYNRKVSESASPGSGTDAARAMYAVQIGNEVVVNNGDWATSISDGSPLSSYYYTSFSQIVMNTETGETERHLNGTRKYDELNIGGLICEYGKITDDYVISAYSQDNAGSEYGADSNMQAINVARLPKTEDDELSMYVNKFAPKKSSAGLDISAVILKPQADGFAGSSLGGLLGEETGNGIGGITILDTDAPLYNEYEKLKSSISASESTLAAAEGEIDAAQAAETISKISGSGRCVKVSADKGNESGIVTASKTYKLRADTDYYYEIEYEGSETAPVTVKTETTSSVPKSTGLSGNRYTVTAVQSEDFNSDESLNSYFAGMDAARVHGGIYYGAEMLFSKDSGGSNKGIFDSSEITFDIEEGETAILQFDYDMASEGSSPDEAYIDINGERWYRNINISEGKGTYTHPFVLPAGKNTVSFGARMYGKRPGNTWIAIDNMKVIFLEKSGAGGADGGETETAGGTSGIIRTPQQIVSYAGMPMTYIKAQASGLSGSIAEITKGSNQNDLKITIPSGKKAVNTAVTLKSSPRDKYPIKWNFDGKAFSVNYKTTSNYYASQVPKEFRVNTAKREGAVSISPGNLYKRSADYGEIEMMLTDEIYAPINEGKYFVEILQNAAEDSGSTENRNGGAAKNGMLYMQDEIFSGNVTFSISGKDEWSVKSFKLYRIENGRRIYEEDGVPEMTLANGWKITGGSAAEEFSGSSDEAETTTAAALVYKKGETVNYNVMYYDYEADPSKAQYWRYTHVPANDGAHPQSGKILSAPIEQFYVDGRYTVEHWQEDSTGNIEYDKQSNIAEMTFYIEGGAGAPWITSIETVPVKVKTGEAFTLKIGVDDLEKDPLSLKTELYHKGKIIYTHQKAGITAGKNGKYPYTNTDPITLAEAGEYTTVCTVSDGSGTGIREYVFKVESADGIKGKAEHFPAWENARLEYNKKHANNPRAVNVFWAAEAFKLSAEVSGKPTRVTATLKEYPQYKVQLASQSVSAGGAASGIGFGSVPAAGLGAGLSAAPSLGSSTARVSGGSSAAPALGFGGAVQVFGGSLFDSKLAADLAKKCSENAGGVCTLNIVFTAEYIGGRTRTDTVTVIIDDNGGSGLKIHRVY